MDNEHERQGVSDVDSPATVESAWRKRVGRLHAQVALRHSCYASGSADAERWQRRKWVRRFDESTTR